MTISKPQIKDQLVGDRRYLKVHTPQSVLPGVKDKESLQATLDWYAYPFIKHRVPDDPYARRRYVELTRPALRFFCSKFGVDVPEWLEGNGHYDQLSPEEHNEMFGPKPLDVQEFEEVPQHKAG